MRETATRNAYLIGAMSLNRKSLEEDQREGRRSAVRLVGYLSIDDDVTPQLARETIESLKVLGVLRASPAVKEALADRIR